MRKEIIKSPTCCRQTLMRCLLLLLIFADSSKMDVNTAVYVRDAVKNYGSKEVLKKLNMKVPKGVM